MRTPFLACSLLIAPLGAAAQCDHDPVISPSAPILCPDESAVLTTGDFDTYQWYRDGQLLPGATEQTLVLPAGEAVGSMFTVAATLNGCTETSPGVLVDGWMFLLPFVIHGGDEPYAMVGEGGGLYCEGDTLTLTLGMPYTENIQWTNFGVPIPGADAPELIVTTSGEYHVTAAPSVCPNTIMALGVTIAAEFTPTAQATITLEGEELCADLTGTSYTWYLDGAPLAGADTQCIPYAANGTYTVLVGQSHPCVAVSEPFLATGADAMSWAAPSVHPQPAAERLHVVWAGHAPVRAWHMVDAAGRRVAEGRSMAGDRTVVDVSALAPGRYVLVAQGQLPVPVVVSR
ncbi:MAG: hypothetical protein RBT71_02860 [Flavobacteriales bacterium]|jgi:hypothetical protein|nr:hypothetical protein [Flavobacteriales bacterium]